MSLIDTLRIETNSPPFSWESPKKWCEHTITSVREPLQTSGFSSLLEVAKRVALYVVAIFLYIPCSLIALFATHPTKEEFRAQPKTNELIPPPLVLKEKQLSKEDNLKEFVKSSLEYPRDKFVERIPGGSIGENFSFLTTPNEDLNEQMPIFYMRKESIQKYIEAFGIESIDFTTKNWDGNPLFLRLLSSRNYYKSLIEAALKEKPELSNQVSPQGKCALEVSAENGSREIPILLMNALDRTCWSEDARWIQKAIKGDCNFLDEEWNLLSDQLKQSIYRIAHLYHQVDLIFRCNQLGMKPRKTFDPIGATPLSQSMDLLEAEKVMKESLIDLRKKGLLFTEEEFQTIVETQEMAYPLRGEMKTLSASAPSPLKTKQIVRKGASIGRIFGAQWIAKKAKELNLKSIKVPHKIAVISSKAQDPFKIDVKNFYFPMSLESNDLIVWAEYIEPCKRTISKEEMTELLTAIQESGFCDIHDYNFVVAKDGIYFIDTENKSMEGILAKEKLIRLECFLDVKDRNWFREQIQAIPDNSSTTKLQTAQKEKLFKKKERAELYDNLGWNEEIGWLSIQRKEVVWV